MGIKDGVGKGSGKRRERRSEQETKVSSAKKHLQLAAERTTKIKFLRRE